MNKTKVICLTPIKNEAWILDKFLAATSLWADHIIIADQMSDDGSREIAKKYPKVILIDNKSKVFNEPERQKLLIEESRKIEGKKLLIALDADEFISGNAFSTEEWASMLSADPGTVFKFKWPFIASNFKQYWAGADANMPFAYMDDGAEHTGRAIHSTRIPSPKASPTRKLNDFVVMHYQFTDWQRMESKHRWYQCFERIQFPEKSVIEIFRRYNHMYQISEQDKRNVPAKWFSFYSENGVDISSVEISGNYYWDKEVEHFIKEYGQRYFKYMDLKENNNLLLAYLRATREWKYSILEKAFDKYLGGIR
ncbi:glycosyltransferase family 2 protein [Psychrobium sp. 1_MG-2023]|uniref:glycosyltransferase family 2 protein n=1 Tax=Psychrobium sp. 1_MG-2023 TaxID=3062624 RepID=UPI000C3321FF|nr:glycosyltransferase family 2 protein [Psychrobium sp. 1_MG-2023]MDP2562083.1 glycosyltransferase family 2 protein [Psychrobium sp. 1_MG-2023]PKF55682.1 glycosyltransferase [Alteromonadales bacterium alter-6D02]